jgi:hypothetical protein
MTPVQGWVLAADGTLAATAIDVVALIRSVDDVTSAQCAPPGSWGTRSAPQAIRARIAAGTWTVLVQIPGLPANHIRVGETISLSLAAMRTVTFLPAINQTLALTRNGKLVVFASVLHVRLS